MRYFLSIFITICVGLTLSTAQTTRQDYIDTYKDLAIKEMKRVGIPASITLSQGMLESGNGNSKLAKKANNHFGIKCHSSWKGKSMRKDDDKKNECFRKYKNAYESYMDHSDFLTRGQRYAFLFDYKITDYKKWARGLKKAGYATSNTYASKLIRIIEDNKLYLYDDENINLIAKKSEPKEDVKAEDKGSSTETKKQNAQLKTHGSKEDYAIHLGRQINLNNRVKYIVAKKGDNYAKLTEEFQLLRFELYRYNDAQKGDRLTKGDIVYLQPKRAKAGSKKHHLVKGKESLRDISQKYGIKLKKLCKYNAMSKSFKLNVGQKVKLK